MEIRLLRPLRNRACMAVLLILVFSTIFLFSKNIKIVEADTTGLHSPSAYENNEWSFPTWAYSSDDFYAIETVQPQKVTYFNYSLEDDIPVGSTIDSVFASCEAKVGGSFQGVLFKVTWDNGGDWSDIYDFDLTTTEMLHTVDVTDATSWTREKLTNENFKIKLCYYAGGCYPNRTYFVTWDSNSKMPWINKNIEKIKAGDTVLAYNEWDGLYFNKVTQIDEHNGTWKMFDIQSGEMKIKYEDEKGIEQEYEFFSHTHLTENHPIKVFRDKKWIKINASSVQLGDFINHVGHEEIELEQDAYVPLENHILKLFEVKTIRTYEYIGKVYNLVTNNTDDRFFSKYLSDEQIREMEHLGINLGSVFDPEVFGKWTVWVDWLPMQVFFTPPIEEEEWDCNYIGLNSTIAGDVTELSADWSDLNASEGLSMFLFSWNNTGTVQNDTWLDSWDGNWTRVTKTLNSTVNLVICARFYVNDTSGEEHASTWLFFTTYLPPNQHPIALFFFTPPNPRRNENVTFNATESSDPDGTIMSYAWDFGDGDTGIGMILNHSFAYDEAYNVTLTVTDDDALTGVCVESITPSATDSRFVVWGVMIAIIIVAFALCKREGYI